MTNSGDAAEQVIRIAFEGVEYTVKIVGAAASQIAAFLLAAFKTDDAEKKTGLKLAGKETLKNFLKSGKETTVFSIKDADLKAFKDEAKRYGLAYCVLKDMDGNAKTVEIMAKAEDSSKIDRIMERLEFAAVDRTSVKSEKTPRAVLKAERRSAKADRRLTNRKSNKVYRSTMRSARQEARSSRREHSRAAYVQYSQDIGRPIKEKKPKERSETAVLFGALMGSILGRVTRSRNSEDNKQTDKSDIPEPEITTPEKTFDEELDEFLPPMEGGQREGQAKDGENKAAQKEAQSQNPSTRTEKSPPSERGSRSVSTQERVLSDEQATPVEPRALTLDDSLSSHPRSKVLLNNQQSVKEFLTNPAVRKQRREQSEKIRRNRTGEKPTRQKSNQHKQPQKNKRHKAKKSRERA